MSSILKVDQIQLANGNTPTAGDLGLNTTGSVLQVVNSGILNTVNANTTSSSFTATGLFVNITPQYSNSKILVLCNSQINYYTANTTWFDGTIYRILGGVNTELASPASNGLGGQYNNSSDDVHIPHFMSVEDSPSTTSQVRYEYYFRRRTGSGILRVNPDSHGVNITAMEIAG